MQTFESPRPRGAEASKPSPLEHPLHVVCFSTYVAERSRQDRHRDVRNFLRALRGERIDGEYKVPVGNEERTLAGHNSDDSIDLFGEMVIQYLEDNGIRPPFGLVPVPTANTTLKSHSGPWTSLLAISIVSTGLEDASILDVLRWKEPLVHSDQRAQTVAELYENLAVIRPLPPDCPIILVDYLFTSSSTLRACAARLRRHGAEVLVGLCAGRTATTASYDPFTVVTGQLRLYHPGH